MSPRKKSDAAEAAPRKKTAAPRVRAAAAPARKPAAAKKSRVVLTVQADPGSTVFLAGSFNGWDPADTRMVDKDGNGLYSVSVTLAPGIYEYKFVINGEWTLDPDPERDWTQNGLGTLNSVLRVG